MLGNKIVDQATKGGKRFFQVEWNFYFKRSTHHSSQIHKVGAGLNS